MAKKHCDHCGAPMVEYKHSMSKQLSRTLMKAWPRVDEELKFHLDSNVFTHSEFTNLHKLKYWGLIEQAGESGWWRFTRLGQAFIRGHAPVQKGVWTYRGDVQRFEGELVYINEATGGWTLAEDYAAEAKAI